MKGLISMAILFLLLGGCGEAERLNRRTQSKSDAASSVEGTALAAAADPNWFSGWDTLKNGAGVEVAKLPNDNETPKTIKATVKKNKTKVKLLDYWLRPTGWTTMWGHALEKYGDKNFRTDGVRWDTPTTWVPKTAKGVTTSGNMTLMTQFGSDIPSWWKGATPYAPQTDWIFNINYENGGIMEIYDRQHFGFNSDGTVKKSFGEVVSTGYYDSLYWSPHYKYTVASDYAFQGGAKFIDNATNKTLYGYSSVEVINQYDKFTVPPARNKGKDCKAAEFKDVIALKHYQFWWDPSTNTSRGDYMVVYMAKNVGWIYMLLNDNVTFDASGSVIKQDKHFLHMSPVGYIRQGGDWQRMCPDEFRDKYAK